MIRKLLFINIVLGSISILLFMPNDARATCANVPAGGDYSVDTSCAFGGTIDGVDGGHLIIPAGKTLTIGAGQTIVWGPGKQLVISGQMAMGVSLGSPGAKLQQTRLWMHDEDNDGYASKVAAKASRSGSSPGAGYRLRSAMQTYEFWNELKKDCMDTGSGSQHVYNNEMDDLLED